eukprot:637703-Rhodomonas_salina.3
MMRQFQCRGVGVRSLEGTHTLCSVLVVTQDCKVINIYNVDDPGCFVFEAIVGMKMAKEDFYDWHKTGEIPAAYQPEEQ